MNKIFWPVLLALTLSACGTTGSGTKATVEDRTGGTTAATSGPGAAGAGVETTAVGGQGVSGSSLDASAANDDPRKNPASPLAARNVFFDFDSFAVKDEYRPMIEAHAGYLRDRSKARVILQGNTDERGSREYNLALGQKRAEAVRRMLAVLGVSDAQVEAVSFGEEKLRNEGDTEAAHAENRRVDIVYADE
ncbi:MAG: peptidoglycan-associated lipoprotein [Pseudomonadota bacterium]|nr:peptidoglycan-associated lipoprotein [Pseudomonadota bacterium]